VPANGLGGATSSGMRYPPHHPARRPARAGFTIIEIIFVFVLFGLVMMMGMRSLGETLSRDRLGKAGTVFAADMELAFSTAARQRSPVRLHIDSVKRRYELVDPGDTTVKYKVRDLSAGEREVSFISTRDTLVDIMPSGFARPFIGNPMVDTVKFGYKGVSSTALYTVVMSRSGFTTFQKNK
jgi:Tfp pilus assembly protein FimT